jgi:hypothetical protein
MIQMVLTEKRNSVKIGIPDGRSQCLSPTMKQP